MFVVYYLKDNLIEEFDLSTEQCVNIIDQFSRIRINYFLHCNALLVLKISKCFDVYINMINFSLQV